MIYAVIKAIYATIKEINAVIKAIYAGNNKIHAAIKTIYTGINSINFKMAIKAMDLTFPLPVEQLV